jgi:hypothetical protein
MIAEFLRVEHDSGPLPWILLGLGVLITLALAGFFIFVILRKGDRS